MGSGLVLSLFQIPKERIDSTNPLLFISRPSRSSSAKPDGLRKKWGQFSTARPENGSNRTGKCVRLPRKSPDFSGDQGQMILLDTNVLSELMKSAPEQRVLAWLDTIPASGCYISVITKAEIELGIALLPDGKRKYNLALPRNLCLMNFQTVASLLIVSQPQIMQSSSQSVPGLAALSASKMPR